MPRATLLLFVDGTSLAMHSQWRVFYYGIQAPLHLLEIVLYVKDVPACALPSHTLDPRLSGGASLSICSLAQWRVFYYGIQALLRILGLECISGYAGVGTAIGGTSHPSSFGEVSLAMYSRYSVFYHGIRALALAGLIMVGLRAPGCCPPSLKEVWRMVKTIDERVRWE